MRAHTLDALPGVLTGQRLTRADLMAALRTKVPGLPLEGQGPAFVTIWASANGLICRAGEQGKEPTYALVDEFVPAAPPAPSDPMAELVRRYVRAFGPVTIADFASWSRLSVPAARRAFADLAVELHQVSIDDHTHYVAGDTEPAERVLRLLPAFDSYLMGYRGRNAFLDPTRGRHVAVGGILRPTIVVDGVIVGTWRLERSGRRSAASLHAWFFDDPPPWQRLALAREVDDVSGFLDRPCELTVERRQPG